MVREIKREREKERKTGKLFVKLCNWKERKEKKRMRNKKRERKRE